MFDWPVLQGIEFSDDLSGRTLIFDTDNKIVANYRTGSAEGFQPSYLTIDSLLLERDLISLQPSKWNDSIPINFQGLKFDVNHPELSRVRYNPLFEEIEVEDISDGRMVNLNLQGMIVNSYQISKQYTKNDDILQNMCFTVQKD